MLNPQGMLGRINTTRKTGEECFRNAGIQLGFTLLDFWRWSSSDLVSNTLRGSVAEFLVARALGVDGGVRSEWDAYDLKSPRGLRIEVKSASYLQTWTQRRESSIKFDIRPTLAWDADTNAFESERRRQADLYVFALLAHRFKPTLDPLDVSQWEFFLVEAKVLDAKFGARKSASLSSLAKLGPTCCSYGELAAAIATFEARSRLECNRSQPA